MHQSAHVGVGEGRRRLFHELQTFFEFDLLADVQEIAQVAAFDELHHDEPLAGGLVLIHRQDAHDVRMVHRHAHSAFALEQFDFVRVLAPALAKDLDGDFRPGPRVIGAEDPAEAAGGNLVEDAEPAEHVAVALAAQKLRRLPGRQVAFAFEQLEEQFGRVDTGTHLLPTFVQLSIVDQVQLAREMSNRSSVRRCHASVHNRSGTD